ncbi:MAG TPA: ribosome assembly factor SBDS [Candidatus Aenigmarchaeota archaeon]|nr:MAG: ribosome assembly factor SBDS [Candidatus Aenigmarchaeota archaeon]HDD46130.1 ribosome assembly factor SBDS [Candidatus Aenigmarchaeota archaeon]
MVSVNEAVIGRLVKMGNVFEILVDPVLAFDLRQGKEVSIESMLATPEIFKDAKKGERVSREELEKVFHTLDIYKIAEQIVKEGQIQITTEQRNEMIENKRKEVANIIARQAIDPKTNLPHPLQRILNAMKEAHVMIDPFKPAKEQVSGVVEKIRSVIPISLERKEIAIKVPIEYAGKASSEMRRIAKLKKEEWTADSWIALIEVPAGIQSEIYSKLNEITSGNVQIKILKNVL